MKYLFESEAEEKETLGRRSAARNAGSSDTEITLGTRSILSIFFGLVGVCAVFFGLGYSVGRGSTVRMMAEMGPSPMTPSENHLPKPSAQQSLNAVAPPIPEADASHAPEDTASSTEPPASHPAPALAQPAPASTPTRVPPTSSPTPQFTSTPAPSPAPMLQRAAAVQPPQAATSFMVQIAAVRVPEDAHILVSALQKHGYTAVVRNEAQDSLAHVQIGPFMTRAEANAMRTRLLGDGYNAVVK